MTFNEDDISDNASTAHSLMYGGEIKTPEQLQVYIDDIKNTVTQEMHAAVEKLTPWFFNNMPRVYYQTTPRAEKVRHLTALISSHLFGTNQTVTLWNADKTRVTYLGPASDPLSLHDVAKKSVSTTGIKMGAINVAVDKSIFVSVFDSAVHKPLDRNNPRVMDKVAGAREKLLEEFPSERKDIERYLDYLDNEFVVYATVGRLVLTYRMLRYLHSHEGAHTFFEQIPDKPTARITLGLKGVSAGEALEKVLYLLSRYGVALTRCFLVTLTEGYEKPLSIIHFHISLPNDKKIDISSIEMRKLERALRTLGWVDSDEYNELMTPQYNFSINSVNLIRSVATWINVMLGKQNPYYYSHYKIRQTFFAWPEITKDLISLFRVRFDPMRNSSRESRGFEIADQALKDGIAKVPDEVERSILNAAAKFIGAIQKTNYFLKTKTGLAFRLSSDILDPRYYPDSPYSIFYMCGREYRMFHCRWKDIARGGLRVVMPKSRSDYEYALAGIFDEVYGLSFAQQLKNKDIPEGGSKGVLLLTPGGDRIRAVRGGVNALLDLLVRDDESHEESSDTLVSYFPKDDIIYLGPDENITNDLIEWIPEQAKRRGYPYAAAFMSSKPNAGINHKQYGVTSEGLNVYVENMLRFLGIDPRKEKFTVAITGGPDGDVGGNELNILHREYGENARVLAIADGFGAAFDPEGLNWQELLRLFNAGLPIAFFDRGKLSRNSAAFLVKTDTPENIKIRNELHARTKCDILLPCGGRPYTVNDKTWNLFLDATGKPSCRAIVEGANIFFTKEARQKLQEAGILMIKDSSANKTGVICSSFEIIASLTISDQEFLEIKDTYVKQVIEILRSKADQEAKLLFREYFQTHGTKTLVDLSMEISKAINSVTDSLLMEIEQRKDLILKDEFFNEMILHHCPKILVDKYRDRILNQLPAPHKIAILSAYMASAIVYREGLSWLSIMSQSDRFKVCTNYMRNEKLTKELMDNLAHSQIEGKEKILAILSMSSTRDLTLLSLGK